MQGRELGRMVGLLAVVVLVGSARGSCGGGRVVEGEGGWSVRRKGRIPGRQVLVGGDGTEAGHVQLVVALVLAVVVGGACCGG